MTKQEKRERRQEIIKLYQDGMSPKNIAAKFGIKHNNSITRIIKANGIDRNQAAPRLTKEEEAVIISEYAKGISSEIIARNMGKNGSTICRALIRNNIQIRPATENKRKYDIVEDFFETIDTETKAYFLGLMYADGNVKRQDNGDKGNDVRIMLHPKDDDILEIFSKEIYGFVKIDKSGGAPDGQKYSSVSVYSQKLRSDLIKQGCTPHKSFDIRFPELFSDDLTRHFIRGYFDGDGSISKPIEDTSSSTVVDITSNYEFIIGIHKYINEVVGIKTQKTNKRVLENGIGGNFQIKAKQDIIAFLEYLYRDATIFMKRKYNSYQIFLKEQDKKTNKANDISKYGTTYISMFGESQLTNEYVQSLSSEEIDIAAKEVFEFYRENGYPYPKYTNDELIRDFNNLKNIDKEKVEGYMQAKTIPDYNESGNRIFKHFSPQFWETKSQSVGKRSMMETFYNDEKFMSVIKNRMNRGYKINGNTINQGLKNSKIAYRASIFFPVVAKTIYSHFCKEGSVIYDYSMGFGQRLLGALSLPFNVKYIGVDPFDKSYNSNKDIYGFFNTNVPLLNKDAEFVCDGSENYCDEKYAGKVDFAFSSPPYFNLEVYNDGVNQAYSGNDYCSFINVWWRKTVANISKMLKRDGSFAINMTEKVDGFNILDDMCGVLIENGFKEVDRWQMQLTRNVVFGNRKGEHKYEPIVIFKR